MSDDEKIIMMPSDTKITIDNSYCREKFRVTLKGEIIFPDEVKNLPENEKAKEFIKCVEAMIVPFQKGTYKAARAEAIEEIHKEFVEWSLSGKPPSEFIEVLTKLSEVKDEQRNT